MALDVERERQRLQQAKQDLASILSKTIAPPAPKPKAAVPRPALTGKMRMACIMDEFTYSCYSPECDLLQITPANWEEELRSFAPHIFFIESAWEGASGLWKRKVSLIADELAMAIQWCRAHEVPVVFWNKEDPTHYDTFLNTARSADFVFTTDLDCIARYKEELGHDNVFLLPFAAQPKVHNPIEKYERKDRFCFAGAYYSRYVERQRDLATFTNMCLATKGLDIYDRMQNDPDPRYTFPDEYRSLIVGSLPPDRIDEAYKGYRYSLNMNSIKQSQTMFARRIFELLASNTLVISNYSRGVRNVFGELVICTDDAAYLRDRFEHYTEDVDRFDKLRLAGLRKTLMEHTYQHRLSYVASKALGHKRASPLDDTIAVVARVRSEDEARAVVASFRSQSYRGKRLFLLHPRGASLESLPEGQASHLVLEDHPADELRSLLDARYLAPFSPADHYGVNYLLDLRLAFSYADQPIVGKACFNEQGADGPHLAGGGLEYKVVDGVRTTASLIDMDRYKPGMTLGDLVQLLEEDTIQGKAMSIDRFNLCVGCKGIDAERVGDLKVLDPGIGIEDLLTIGESVRPRGVRVKMSLTSRDMLDALARSKDNRILASPLGATALIESRLDEGEVRYLNLRKRYEVAQVSEGDELQYYLDATPGLDLSIVAYFHDRYGQRMDHDISPSMRRASHRIPDGCKEISFGLRVRGKGKCNLLQLKIGPDVQRLSFFVPKSKALLLTNHYPSYEDLYRNGFVHRRVCEYRENGLPVDVMKFHPNHREEFLEYRGIDVVSGHSDVLETVLATGLYDTLMVHFLDAGMWDRIMPRLGAIKVFIWIHGAEVQPWHRRGFNFADEAERRKAQQQSESRIDLWRRVFSTQSDSLHFIFVSNYFAKEVMEDIGVELDPSRYSIIHNFIDTDLFDYVPKPALQRLRVLSIRPYASKKYANDLSAAAITELSKRPVFQELRFLLIGDGPLFEEIVAPLSRFSNVEVQRRFVPQEEIASIHKEYGIFLTPTRMDSQGVSRDEAMSSGLVPVTNAVTAIPEFVDDSCAILAPGEDHLSLAEGIERLALDPDRFLAMSKRAAARVRKQCGRENTILRELKLVGAPGAGDRGSGTP